MKTLQTCRYCKSEFYVNLSVVKQGGGVFCSPLCRKEHTKSQQVMCNCQQCGNTFYVWPSNKERGKGVFCSKKCHFAHKVLVNTVHVLCGNCGKQFSTVPSRIQSGAGKYCSRKCNMEAKTLDRITCICGNCNSTFETTRSEVSRGGGKFCSLQCYYSFVVGENSHLWRGGQVNEYPKEFFKIRDFIVQRDKGRCQICKSKSHLAVHHISGNKNDNSVENLITLCQGCHMTIHAGKQNVGAAYLAFREKLYM